MPSRETKPPTKRKLPAAFPRRQDPFSQLVEGVQDYAIFLLDATGHVRSWNSGAERIKGYRAEEIVGKHFSTFYSKEDVDRAWPQEELEIVSREGRFETEGWRYRKDGSRFWASVVITAERNPNGELEGFLKITRDLSERKRAEESLRQSEERLRLLIEGVRDHAIFALSAEGIVSSWNTGAQRIKGYRAEEILGKHFSVFYPPEELAGGKPDWLLRAAAEHGSVEDSGWRVRKDGNRFWANVLITALRDERGELRGFAKVTRDLTEKRRIDQLQEADRFKNEFLAVLAHELRNPLAPIRTAVHVLTNPNAAPPELAHAQEIAERQINHMSRLLEDLLDIARISQGRLEIRKEITDVCQIVRAAVDAEQPLMRERSLQLTVDLPTAPVAVDADPGRLQQVFVNLLNNAAKYTEPGGRIHVAGRSEGGDVVIRIRDSGIGIDSALIPMLFEPFVQVERRERRSAGGVGLGLAVVKKLVEMHGGNVHVLSAGLGRGSEFVVRLPRSVEDARTERMQDRRRPRSARHLRVLVVDDNVDAADGLKLLLELDGEEARVAYDGDSALKIARDFQPHVALLDVGMPIMDGYETARRLRENGGARKTILVAVTGLGQSEDRRRSKEAGFDLHLVKPVEPAMLERILDSIKSTAEI